MVSNELQQRVAARVEECYTRAEAHYGRTFDRPTWDFNCRGRAAGWAKYVANTMRFNYILLSENADDFIHRTVAHECAHLICWRMYKDQMCGNGWNRKVQHHGRHWKSVMRVLGVNPSRCHSYDTTNSTVKRAGQATHIWKCRGCGEKMELGPKRHQKQLAYANGPRRGSIGYYMRGCKRHGGYEYVGIEGVKGQIRPRQENFATAADTPAKVAAGPNPHGRSKIDQCVTIYRQQPLLSRGELINLFVNHAGCTPAGAATYYAKIKKHFG